MATFTWIPRFIRHLRASLISGVTPWQSSRASAQPLARTGPMALGSPVGCIVPQDRRLLWPYPSFCTPPSGLLIMSAWPCAFAPAAEVPQFTLPILCVVPSSILRWFQQVRLTMSSLPMLSSHSSQTLDNHGSPANPDQSGSCLEAAMFALCYGPHALLALLWSGLLLPSFRRWGRPQSLRRISLHGSSFITMAGSSPAGLAALWAAGELLALTGLNH